MRQKALGVLLVLLFMGTGLSWRYAAVLRDPNHSFFNLNADGLKNYAVVMYHVQHDSTYTYYEGMNYPYGEHIMFTDGQPLLSNTLKWLDRRGLPIAENVVAIMNLAMISSFALGAVIFFLLLLQVGLPLGWSIPVAVGVLLLSPQAFRVESHYSLAYGFVLPGLLYLLYLYHLQPNWRRSLYLGIYLTLVALLHFYYFGMAAVLLLAYAGFAALRRWDWRYWLQLGGHFALQALLPYALLQSWLWWTDPLTDRPATPMGFLVYHAYLEGIFLARDESPLGQWIHHNLIDVRDLGVEGKAYLGLAAGLGLLYSIYQWLRHRGRQPFLSITPAGFLRELFPALFVLLLLALGLPFILPGFETLVQYAGPYRQFRGQGRFAWVFYYGWHLIFWPSFFHFVQQQSSTWRRWAWPSAAFLLLLLDVVYFSRATAYSPQRSVQMHRSAFEQTPNYWFRQIRPADYQAVFPIPFYHVGSENFNTHVNGSLLLHTLTPGLHFGLPNLGVFLSRSSYQHTLEKIPFMGDPYRPFVLPPRLPNNKPLLVVIDKAQLEASKYKYSYLLRFATTLYEDEQVRLCALPLAAFDQAVQAWRQDIDNGWFWAPQLYPRRNGLYSSDSTKTVLYRSFDQKKSPKIYQGKGAWAIPVKRRVPLLTTTLPDVNNTVEVWVYMGADQHPRVNFKAFEQFPNGEEKLVAHIGSRFDFQLLDPNGWGLVAFPLNISDRSNPVRLELELPEMELREVYLDELLIRPSNAHVFWDPPGWIVYDNQWFPR